MLDGNLIHAFQPQSFVCQGTLLLFSGRQGTDSKQFACDSYIYGAKVYESGELIADMVPVRFTNALGLHRAAMYDRVRKLMLVNGGDGEMSYGPDKS